ncbi:MAG: hypothetical protein ACREXU_20650, partial [Gammaproteobacteria bacterium]
VKDGKVLGVNELELAERIQGAQDRTLATVHERDYLGRSHWDISPLSLPLWESPPSGGKRA